MTFSEKEAHSNGLQCPDTLVTQMQNNFETSVQTNSSFTVFEFIKSFEVNYLGYSMKPVAKLSFIIQIPNIVGASLS